MRYFLAFLVITMTFLILIMIFYLLIMTYHGILLIKLSFHLYSSNWASRVVFLQFTGTCNIISHTAPYSDDLSP